MDSFSRVSDLSPFTTARLDVSKESERASGVLRSLRRQVDEKQGKSVARRVRQILDQVEATGGMLKLDTDEVDGERSSRRAFVRVALSPFRTVSCNRLRIAKWHQCQHSERFRLLCSSLPGVAHSSPPTADRTRKVVTDVAIFAVSQVLFYAAFKVSSRDGSGAPALSERLAFVGRHELHGSSIVEAQRG